jgi:hypothetical protein
MKQHWVRVVAVALVALFTSVTALAQGSTASITGIVVDSDGGVIPGATVVVKNNGTGETFTAVTSGQGVFAVPSVNTGTYTVTVSLEGFRTVALNNVVVNAGVPASLRATLEIGGLTEQVIVQSNAELVQTASATVATTLDTRQVANLPLSNRSAAAFIVNLPGVSSPGVARDSIVNGLPQSSINMSLDGVNIQDNTLKTTDGFFAIVAPRIDAIEEITYTTAATGAEGSGSGATQIRYVTKSGTNTFRGGVFHQYRSDALNANTWFNKRDGLPTPELLQNQYGFSLGGPILLPGFNGRNKAFFFVNYEENRSPGSVRRNRQILHPEAQAGVFRYQTAQGVQRVNVLELAAANGQLAATDPVITRLLADIRNATATEGSVRELTDPLFQQYSFQIPTTGMTKYPTVRVDYQVNDKHRLTWSLNFSYPDSYPDTTNNREVYFPGFPVTSAQHSIRRATSGWLRSILGPNLVNEMRIGYGGAPIIFNQNELTPEMWNGPIANQGGFHLDLSRAVGITTTGAGFNAGNTGTTSARDAFHRSVENTLNWQKGSHSLNIGGSFTQFDYWAESKQIVPELRFGLVSGDPAEGLFTTANFPGASTTNLNNARGLYAILTGRVNEVRYLARLNEDTGQYEALGQGIQRARQQQFGFWAQDGWRARPNLTLNFGVRYDMTFPFIALNNSYSIGDLGDVYGQSGVGNLFKPGTLTGKVPEFRNLTEGERAYPMDWNNIAPSVGMAWTPSAKGGLLRRLTGETGDMAIRAGYSRSYTRQGISDFTGQVGNNPGVTLEAFRTATNGNLGALPLLLRDASRLTPADFSATPVYPFRDVVGGDITVFSPDLIVPVSDTWQAGVTRALGRSMSIEARYLGARSTGNWRTNNYNELNLVENGFLDEFKMAMANLQANNAAGGTRAGSFAYFGPGSGTAPLPIYLAYFSGLSRDRAGDAAAYANVANFRSNTYVTPLARFNPHPYAVVDAFNSDATLRGRALAAGLPSNFLLVNPDLLGGANIIENETSTFYNSMGLEFKRRSASGLAFAGSYVLGHATETNFLSLRVDSPMVRNGGEEGDVTQAFKLNAVYPLPFGQGRRFGSGAGAVLNRLIGGWQLAGIARVQSGRLIDLGNVRLVGMTKDELSQMFKLRIDAQNRVLMLPQDIIDETVKAFNVSATSASGYGNLGPPSGRYIAPADSFDCIETVRGFGDCGLQSVMVTGPIFKQFDLSLVKSVEIVGRVNLEFRVDALNVFNNVNFSPLSGITIPTTGANTNRSSGAAQADYETTSIINGDQARIVQLGARIRW